MNHYSNWPRVNKLIDEALKLEKEERKEFLESECGIDKDLLFEAKDFLYHAEDICFLESFVFSSKARYRKELSKPIKAHFKNK